MDLSNYTPDDVERLQLQAAMFITYNEWDNLKEGGDTLRELRELLTAVGASEDDWHSMLDSIEYIVGEEKNPFYARERMNEAIKISLEGAV